ncbi:DUF2850 domain-containing protein [Vibrio ostreicida]|uniref:DUF2850 domain-containing protein n=1 Tax=Vibrio ostreicida TaxID=526588 RepID=A0ABT8C067_9VIBR|nr:DUF2850 domain-containing protein [Vibrio ostreicida]MDN3612462.1 DUF2850 domain-containing protein [Vibrio ostreicida]NPD10171.1 DUF2850 domain-containing protein [Vibrio ostreicida]
MPNHATLKLIFSTLFVVLAIAFSSLLYISYEDYVNPNNVYGRWLEIGTPGYNTEVMAFNEIGVFRNGRLIATTFTFDGQEITVTTGNGNYIYAISGTFDSPQLRRLQPNSPTQRFIKEGYEKTVNDQSGGQAKQRRAALSDHFSDKK